MAVNPDTIIYPKASEDPKAQELLDSPEQLAILDARLELALVLHCEKINEGNNGVIFKLNIEEDAGEELEVLVGYIDEHRTGVDEKENVVKILKLYKPGTGKREFEMQRKAYEIVRDKGVEDCAKIPEPVLFRDLELKNLETIEFLSSKGIKAQDHVEVIIMDMVPGVDLATHFYREVLRGNKGAVHLQNDLDIMDFPALHREVSQILKFETAGGKSRDEGEREFERRMVQAGNAEKIFSTLKKQGYVLDPRILNRIEKTIDMFHENGLAFRDGHHRNFMFSGEGDDLDVFVIDFGSSTTFEGDLTRDVYIEGDKEYPHDKAVIQSLRSLTKTQEELAAEELKDVETDLKGLRRLLSRKEEVWQQTISELGKKGLELEQLYNLLGITPLLKGQSLEIKNKALVALLIDFVQSGKYTREEVKQALKKFIEEGSDSGKLPVSQVNQLVKFLKIL